MPIVSCPQCGKAHDCLLDLSENTKNLGTLFPEKVMQPTWGNTYTDPVFGTKVRRISDAEVQGSESIATEYSTVNPWNAGRTRLLLVHHDRFGMYDADGEFIHSIPIIPAGSEPRWHPMDPNWLLFLNGNSVWGYNQSTGVAFENHKFAQFSKISALGESDLSRDGDHIVLVGDDRHIFLFNYNDKVETKILDTGGKPLDSVMLTDDNRVLVSWKEISGPEPIQLYDRFGTYIRDVTRANGHKDLFRNWLVWANSNDPHPIANARNAIVRVDLETGEQVPLLELDWSLVVHVSCADTGWACISTFPWFPESEWRPFTNEVFLLHIGTGEVRRLCHHRSKVERMPDGQPDYTAEAKAVISRDGKRVLYSSNWCGRVDAFSIEV